jgi:hypothetical protein
MSERVVAKGLIRIATIIVTGMMVLFIIAAIKAPSGAPQQSSPASAASCSTDSGSTSSDASQASWRHKKTSRKTTTHKTPKRHHKKTIKRA